MPATGGPGQQATLSAISAMPATRATGIATPVSCSPNNNCPTNDGTISNANPVVASPTAARTSALFIRVGIQCYAPVEPPADAVILFRSRLTRIEFDGKLVNLAGEFEWCVVAILQKRQRGAGVHSDIEGLVFREGDRRAVLHGISGHFLTVHIKHACAAFAQTGFNWLVVELDCVLTGFQIRPLPHGALEIEQVVKKHDLASPKAEFAFAEEQAVATEPPSLGHDHAFRSAVWDHDGGGNGVRFIEQVRCSALRNASQ